MRRRLLFLLFIFPLAVVAQQHAVDSLVNLLKTDKEDTLKVKHLCSLCWDYRVIGDNKNSLGSGNQALALAKKLGYKKGMASAYNNIGAFYFVQSDLKNALFYFLKEDSIYRITGDNKGLATTVANIGLIYYDQGDYPRSLDYQLKGMELEKGLNDTLDFGSSYGNIGNIYHAEGDLKKALSYHVRALRLDQINKDIAGQSDDLINIGIIYNDMKQYDTALKYNMMALELSKQIGDTGSMASITGNIGVMYFAKGDYQHAYESYVSAMKLDEKTNNKEFEARVLNNIGEYFMHEKNYAQAETYLLKGYRLADSLKRNEDIKFSCDNLSKLYDATNQYQKAYQYYKIYAAVKDSLVSEDKSKEIGRLEAKADYDKQLTLQQAEGDKKAAVSAAESKRQKLTILFVGAIALAVAFIAILIFRSLYVTRKQKALIELQKKEVEEQKVLIENQKAIVDEKNKDITDSIHYASRIQRALITSEEYIGQYVKEYFIYFKPRDIVSGDFYWAFGAPPTASPNPSEGGALSKNVLVNPPLEGREAGLFYLACCDCTGHGVPGAFMSLLNISMLNESVIERKIAKPDLVLNDIRTNIIKALNPDGSDKGKDGMDCSLMAFDFKNLTLNTACANNPVWVISDPLGNRMLTEVAPDKMPVGIQHGSEKPFTLHTLQLKRGDCVYAFTDGFADQFGGPKGKKFKYKQLQELLMANAHKRMGTQKEILGKAFEEWKGDLEQIDDVLIIGIRV